MRERTARGRRRWLWASARIQETGSFAATRPDAEEGQREHLEAICRDETSNQQPAVRAKARSSAHLASSSSRRIALQRLSFSPSGPRPATRSYFIGSGNGLSTDRVRKMPSRADACFQADLVARSADRTGRRGRETSERSVCVNLDGNEESALIKRLCQLISATACRAGRDRLKRDVRRKWLWRRQRRCFRPVDVHLVVFRLLVDWREAEDNSQPAGRTASAAQTDPLSWRARAGMKPPSTILAAAERGVWRQAKLAKRRDCRKLVRAAFSE